MSRACRKDGPLLSLPGSGNVESKMSQLAEKVDIEVKHLGRIERGERQPSFDLIIALAKCLNVSPSKFFEFESTADPKTLRKNIDQLLSNLDPKQLGVARQVLTALF